MRPIDVVRKTCPHARQEYIDAFEAGDKRIADAGITTPRRLAHFLAQVFHETDGLTIATENGNYTATRIVEVWPSRFRSVADAAPYARNPEKLFNSVYANRMGNGPPGSGDGFRYRGRGLLQTTGRESYRKYGKRVGADFEGSPDLVVSAEWALIPALAEWVDGGCSALADADDLRGITKRINGGYIGIDSRKAWLRRVTAAIGGEQISRAPNPIATAAVSTATVVATGHSVLGYDIATVTIAAVVVGAIVLGITYAMRRAE